MPPLESLNVPHGAKVFMKSVVQCHVGTSAQGSCQFVYFLAQGPDEQKQVLQKFPSFELPTPDAVIRHPADVTGIGPYEPLSTKLNQIIVVCSNAAQGMNPDHRERLSPGDPPISERSRTSFLVCHRTFPVV